MFPRTIRRDVILLLCLKAAALALIYVLFVAPATHAEPSRGAMWTHLVGTGTD
jgi:hypothetical protein